MLNKAKNWSNNLITKSFMKVFIMLICFLLIGTESSYCNGFEKVIQNIFDENNFLVFIIAEFLIFLIWFIILKIRRKERTLIPTILTVGIFGLIILSLSFLREDIRKGLLEVGFVVFIITAFLISLIWFIILKINKKKDKGMATTLTIATIEIIGLIIFIYSGIHLGEFEQIAKIFVFQFSLLVIITILFLVSLIRFIILKMRKKDNKVISTIFIITAIGILAILVLITFDNEIKQLLN